MHYLMGNEVIVQTDHHSLKWLKTFKRREGILARWVETLAELDFEIKHQPGRLRTLKCKSFRLKTPYMEGHRMDRNHHHAGHDELRAASPENATCGCNPHEST